VADGLDVSWLDAGRNQPGTVGFFIPPGFPVYARILHPVYYYKDDGTLVDVTWAAIAEMNGKSLSSMSNFDAISPGESYGPPGHGEFVRRYGGPMESFLPDAQMESLIGILEGRTSAPSDCTFLWVHGVDSGLSEEAATWVNRAAGRCQVMTGMACSDAMEYLPSIWWPGDLSWIVITEVDMNSTFIGCDRETLNALLNDEHLEAFEVSRYDVLAKEPG
jgi:hypothetical protein